MSDVPARRFPELRGRVAVVTGGAKGIGRGIAQRLASEGMKVVIADVDEAGLTSTVTELAEVGKVVSFPSDVSKPDDVSGLFSFVTNQFGTVDLLVNNAADLRRRRLLEEHEDVLELQLNTNIKGPYLCSQKAAAIMVEGEGGSIVHISSVGGLRAHDRGLPYDVTKGAIDAMTRAMAVDLGEYGIRVNAVAPGITHPDPTAGSDLRDDRVPLQRAGTPFDVASAVAFLASSDADYITGQVIYVDGGYTAQLSPQGEFDPDDRDGEGRDTD